jgi:Mg2+/Co2+ transporter CorC
MELNSPTNKELLDRIANMYFQNEPNKRNKILDFIKNNFK